MSEFKISCPKCQQHLLLDESYSGAQFACPSCGAQITVPPLAGQAVQAETRIADVTPAPPARTARQPHIPPRPKLRTEPKGKSWLTTFFLAWFLGGLGIDRFYNGRTGLGLGKLLTGGLCGLWSIIDVFLLLFKKYQDAQGNYLRPAKRSHMVVALSVVGIAMLMSVILIGSAAQGLKSEFAKMGSGALASDSRDGFASPEAVFEAMKANPTSRKLLPPEERRTVALMNVMIARAVAAAQSDETKKQEAEKAFTDLIEKYQLADKLEFNASSEMEDVQAMADKAFTNLDLTALMDDFHAFAKKYSTEHFHVSDDEDEAKPVSLKGLKIEGDEATATMISSDDTEHPIVFVKSDGSWFYSMDKTNQKRAGGSTDGWGTGSEPLLLVVTFDSESSLKQATAKGLLEAVDYDRSEVPELTPAGTTHHEATLSFNIPPSANKEAIIQSIRRVRGVAKVENLWTEEMEATMAAKFAEAFSAATNQQPNTSWEASAQISATGLESRHSYAAIDTMGMDLKVTFDSEVSAKGATATQLLAGVTYDRGIPARLEPTESPLQARLWFVIPLSSFADRRDLKLIEDIIKRSPGVKDVQNDLLAVTMVEVTRDGKVENPSAEADDAAARKMKSDCVGQLKQVGLAFREWAMDHGGQFPFNVPTAKGGTLEFCQRTADGFDANAFRHFQVLSNLLIKKEMLICPGDRSAKPSMNWGSLTSGNVSYKLRTGAQISERNPGEVLVQCPTHENTLYCDGSVIQKSGYQTFTSSAAPGALSKQAENTPIEPERDDLFSLNATNVTEGEKIEVTFRNPMRSSQGQRYWITVIDAKLNDAYSGKRKDVPDGATNIILTTPKKTGDFEVRLHSDYPMKSFHVVQRTRLKIETAASRSSEAALRFDHVTNGVVNDLSPGGHDGKMMGGAKIAKPSLPTRNAPEMKQVMDFDGNDSYVEMANNGSHDLNLLPITITFWMRTTANDRVPRGVVNKYFSGSHNGYQLYLNGGNLCAWYFGTSGRVYKGKGSELHCGDMSDGQWHHVAFIVDDKSGGQLFVDGVLRDSCPWTGTPSATATGEPLRLGTYPSRSSIDGDFIGQMSEVAIWNEARTKEQIYEEMAKKLTGTEPGLAGYWKLDSVINGGFKFK